MEMNKSYTQQKRFSFLVPYYFNPTPSKFQNEKVKPYTHAHSNTVRTFKKLKARRGREEELKQTRNSKTEKKKFL